MTGATAPRFRGRILTRLLALLFALSVAPLLWTSWQLVSRSRDILEYDQKQSQLDKARALSQQVGLYVTGLEAQLQAMSRALETQTGPEQFQQLVDRLRTNPRGLARFLEGNSGFTYVSVVDASGAGVRAGVQLPDPE